MERVAPCYALESVKVQQDDAAKTITLTVIEGSWPGEVACIDIAVLKATFVDLGDLAAGKWTISADGDAPAITLEPDSYPRNSTDRARRGRHAIDDQVRQQRLPDAFTKVALKAAGSARQVDLGRLPLTRTDAMSTSPARRWGRGPTGRERELGTA